MSGEVRIRLWLTDAALPERLGEVSAAVSRWPAVDAGWEPVRTDTGIAATGVPVRLADGAVRLGVEAWAAGHPRRPDRDLDGDAGLWFSEAGPVLADPEALIDLLLLLVDRLGPDRLAVHDEGGFHHPLNARAVYHRTPQGFAEDLAVLGRLWEHGSPAWRLPPLRDPGTPLDNDALHSERSPHQRAEVWARIPRLPPSAPLSRVEAALAARPDRVTRGPETLLVASPRIFDGFVDDFYTQLGSADAAGAP